MVHSGWFKDAMPVHFYRLGNGREPVREWLRSLPRDHRKRIGRDILTLQLGWPLGMPLARKLRPGLWEVRTQLQNSVARVIFTVRSHSIVLLHGFVKKSQKTPVADLELALKRMKSL